MSASLTHRERQELHAGVCPAHRDAAPGVYVCGPCERAGDEVVEAIVAARENAVHLEWIRFAQDVTGLRLMTVDEAREALERRGDPE